MALLASGRLLTKSLSSKTWACNRLMASVCCQHKNATELHTNQSKTTLNHSQTRRTHSEVEDFIDLKVEVKDNETTIEAVPRPTGREGLVVNSPDGNCSSCALCRLNLVGLDYTDVLILSQFIKRDGSIATQHESKLCGKQYHKVRTLIRRAQRCNLIKRPNDYFVPGAWHDLNTYIERDRKRDQPMTVIKKEYWRISGPPPH